MIKKILFAGSILAVTSTVVFADAAPYIGGSVGIVNNTVNVTWAHNDFTLGSYRGVPFSIFAGYGGVVNQNFYLGGELTATLATANLSDNAELKTSYGVGASVMPGIMLSDHTLAYARVGVVRSHFSSGSGENRNGGQFGLGMQTSLTQNLDLRGEYNFVAYRSVSENGASFSPRSDQFNLGLVYKFD